MYFERKTKRRKHLNLTSLIDVIFLLIVFFMLTSKFSLNQAINLDIAQVVAGDLEPEIKKDIIVIKLNSNNKVTLGKNTFDISLLGNLIHPKLLKMPDTEIHIIPLNEVNVQQIVSLMDVVKIAGGNNITLSNGRD